jgi:N-methylhydantoinase B
MTAARRRRRGLDPITFEVLRHRLWEINDEQGLIAAQISGSAAVYEAGDYNTSILTPEGDGLFVGVYVIRQAASLDMVVKTILAQFGDDGGIADGDVFTTNDPWAGALHMNDMALASPVFWRDRIVAWIGIVMHEMDVGGPVPGSWSVGARDVYGEAPLIPPVKVLERGRLRREIEGLLLRNSRTAAVNGLNLRARIASQHRTTARLHDIIRRYGVDTFLAVQRQIVRTVRGALRRRLRELPDGSWSENGYLDHDGRSNVLYELRCTMTKRRDRLTFDFRGTARQAPGAVNCAPGGLAAGVQQVLFPMLCYDLPWCNGALRGVVDIVAEPGTINNATHPAGVSMAPVNACQATGNLVISCLSKMYACSARYREEAMAVWYPGINGIVLGGITQEGRPLAHLLLDPVGGGGARSFKDGINAAGALIAPSYAIPNVERNESLYPILQVYRKHARDTAGAGAFRGGVGLEFCLVPYDNPAPQEVVIFSSGVSQPEARGIAGGCPGSLERDLVLRRADVRNQFARGAVPADVEEIGAERVDLPQAKDRVTLGDGDAIVNFCAGGGGYGDPLGRDPALVARDVRLDLCSREVAEQVYGVRVGPDGAVDEAGTRGARQAIRARRLAEARPVDARLLPGVDADHLRARIPPQRGDEPVLMPMGEAVEVVVGEGVALTRCRHCRRIYGPAWEDPKVFAVMREAPMTELSPRNRYGLVDEIVIRQFYCPGCAAMFTVNVQRRGDPILLEFRLALGEGHRRPHRPVRPRPRPSHG